MNEEPPKEFENHIDDPTHPAGNADLAYEMAHAGKERREMVAAFGDFMQTDATRASNQEKINAEEEQARTEYIKTHPELTEAASIGEEVLEQAGMENPDDQNIEDKAGSKEEEPAAEDDDDKELMRKQADAMDTVMTTAARLEQTGDPSDAELAKTLRERGNELADEAKEQYEQEQVAFEAARDFAIGRLVASIRGDLVEPDGTGPILCGINWGESVDFSGNEASPQAIEEIKRQVYAVADVEPPSREEFLEAMKDEGGILEKMDRVMGDSQVVGVSRRIPGTDLRLVEHRTYNKVGKLGQRQWVRGRNSDVAIFRDKAEQKAA